MVRDRAILARVSRSAEGKILTFFTPRFGKVPLYYRNFSRRRKVEFLDPLRGGELIFTPSARGFPGRLHSFHCETVWPHLRADFDRLVSALHLLEGVTLMSEAGEPAPERFTLLEVFLQHLETGGDPSALRLLFDLRLLQEAGFAPLLDRCLSCRGEAAEGDVTISVREGGLLCPRCRALRPAPARRISQGALSFLRRGQKIPIEKAARLRLGGQMAQEIQPLLDEMVAAVLERQPPSAFFLAGLRKPSSPGT